MTTPTSETEEFEFLYQMEKEAQQGTPPPNPAPVRASMGDVIAGTPLARFAMGAASPVIGVAQLGAHAGDAINRATGVEPVVSPWLDKALADFEAAKRRGMKESGTEGVDAMGLLGSLAPSAALAKGATAGLPVATTLLQRAGVGATQGGIAAAAQPVTETDNGFWSPKGLQTAVGTVTGGVVPLLASGGKALGKFVTQAAQPFTEKGREAILNGLQNAVLGNDPHLRKIAIDMLRQAKPGVGGVTPTAGEVLAGIDDPALAAKFTGLMAHQKNIAKLPGVSPEFQSRAAAQAAAREAEIGTIAKTPQALEQATRIRSAVSTPLYEEAGREIVTPDAAFKVLASRPSMKSVFSRAADLAKEQGDTFKIGTDMAEHTVASPLVTASGQPILNTVPETIAQYPVKSLHYMKTAMDDLIKNPERFGIGASEARAIGQTQQEFVKWLGAKSPNYDMARNVYRALSIPKNRMEVGQELQKSLTTPLGTSERGAMFAKAKEEAPRTIKRATGQQMFDSLDEILTPTEMRSVTQVGGELARKDAFERLARQTSLSGSDAIPGQIGLPLPNLLYRPSMIANFMLRHAGKGTEEKIAKLAASQYLQPNQLAVALEGVPPRYAPMMNALRQRIPAMAGAAGARTTAP